jgi:hypothetical protein
MDTSPALAQHGRQVVHADAIAPDGRAVLVLGGTGAGKSTLALCALRREWRVLADDLVALQLRDGEPYVAGIPRPIVVPRDVLGDGATPSSRRGDPRERSELLAVAPHAGWHPVVGSLHATHAAEPGARLERLDGPERLPLVLGSCLAMGDPARLREVFTVAAAVARRPGMALRHSRDPRTRLDDGMRVLEEARARIGFAD